MILQLAFRNLLRHKRNSLIIFILFTLIISLFFIGNAVMAESGRGLKRKFIDNFTGHLAVQPPTTVEVSLFGAVTPSIGEYYTLPSLKDRDRIDEILAAENGVTDTTGLVIGAAALDLKGNRATVPLFGIEGEDYFRFFPDLRISRGDPLAAGRTGVMITAKRAARIERETGREPQIGDPVLLSMYGRNGFKIREVPLTGIFSYSQSDPVLDEMVLTDLQTLRALNSLSLAVESDQIISEEDSSLLEGDLEDLFGGEGLFAAEDGGESIDPDDLAGMVEAPAPGEELYGGSWHFLLVKLADGRSAGSLQKRIGKALEDAGLEARVVDWRQAAGLSARLVLLLRLLYNGGFLLVALAGIIAMVNILLIALFERTGEIGTLRAMGARRSYIRRLILLENLSLAGAGGLAGVLAGTLILNRINALNLRVDNRMIASLLGQEQFFVAPGFRWALISLVTSLLLGAAASLYPLSRALKIQPSAAQRRG